MQDPLEKYRRRQPMRELLRKQQKAQRVKQKIWTLEDIDWAYAEAQRLRRMIKLK